MRCLDKILIVDDHPTNVAILEEELGDNYALSTALSGEAALRQVIEFQPDLMLLDIMMPGPPRRKSRQAGRLTPTPLPEGGWRVPVTVSGDRLGGLAVVAGFLHPGRAV